MNKLIGLTQRVDIANSQGERRDALDQLWTKLLEKAEFVPIPIPNQLADVETYIRRLNLDGIILTGGNDLSSLLEESENHALERDKMEEKLLTVCGRKNIPVLGVCRGMQMMVSWTGGKIVPVCGHVAVRHALHLNEEGKRYFCERDSINSYHRYTADLQSISREWLIMATSPDGSIEAIRHERYPFWAIMWHPERESENGNDIQFMREVFHGNR